MTSFGALENSLRSGVAPPPTPSSQLFERAIGCLECTNSEVCRELYSCPVQNNWKLGWGKNELTGKNVVNGHPTRTPASF